MKCKWSKCTNKKTEVNIGLKNMTQLYAVYKKLPSNIAWANLK